MGGVIQWADFTLPISALLMIVIVCELYRSGWRVGNTMREWEDVSRSKGTVVKNFSQNRIFKVFEFSPRALVPKMSTYSGCGDYWARHIPGWRFWSKFHMLRVHQETPPSYDSIDHVSIESITSVLKRFASIMRAILERAIGRFCAAEIVYKFRKKPSLSLLPTTNSWAKFRPTALVLHVN